MSILLAADFHLHPHRKSLDRLDHCLQTLEWAFNTADEYNCRSVIIAGDLFHDRQKIDILVYLRTFEIIKETQRRNPKFIFFLVGNHDMWHHEKWDINSVKPLSALPDVTVISEPCTEIVDRIPMDFLPYTKSPIETIAKLRSTGKRNYLVGHIALHGAQTNTYHHIRSDVVIEHDGEMTIVDADIFKGYEKVWLGHYHDTQRLGDVVEYIGSPLELSFGEAFTQKHVIVWDPKKDSIKYVENTFSPKHLIIKPTELKKYDLDKNFVRLYVKDIGAAEVIDMQSSLASQHKMASLEIMPVDKKAEDSEMIAGAKAILYKEGEMLKQYVNSVAHTGLEEERLLKAGEYVCDYSPPSDLL